MKSAIVFISFLTICLGTFEAKARVNTSFTKSSLGRYSKKPTNKRAKKNILRVSKLENASTIRSGSVNSSSIEKNSIKTNSKILEPQSKIGFTNQIQLGYSNSAYRYAGENYPAKSLDFGIAPTFETTCFSIDCVYLAKIIGGFDLNNNSKGELALFQMGLKFPGSPWGGMLAPAYSFLGYLPATQKELNEENMTFGIGTAFALATTPELVGSEGWALTGTISFRKNYHQGPLVAQQDWTTRQALIWDINFTPSIGATLIFAHIYGINHDDSENEFTELIQSLKWKANEWLELNIGHGNKGPLFKADSTDVNTDLVSIENSVLSFGISITNKF